MHMMVSNPNILPLRGHLQWFFSPADIYSHFLFWYSMPVKDLQFGTSLQRMYRVQTSLSFLLCHMWTLCLMWKAWSTKHFEVLEGSGRPILKPSLITKALWNHRVMCVIFFFEMAWGTELASIATSKSSRIYRRVCYCLLCRCVASQNLWKSQKATKQHREGLLRRYLSQVQTTCWWHRQ